MLEAPLLNAFDASRAPGSARFAAAQTAADLALALVGAKAAPQTQAGAQACVALAMAVLAATRAQPSDPRALLEAAADMAAAITDEIPAALEDRAAMAALLSAYADHL